MAREVLTRDMCQLGSQEAIGGSVRASSSKMLFIAYGPKKDGYALKLVGEVWFTSPSKCK